MNQKQVIGTLSGWYGAGVGSRQTDWLLPLENLLEGLGERWRVSGTAGNAAGADKTDPKTFAMADDPEEPDGPRSSTPTLQSSMVAIEHFLQI